MAAISRSQRAAHHLLTSSAMQHRFAVALLVATACGQIDFGSPRSPEDGGPDPQIDSGVDVSPDTGLVLNDTGATSNDECIPVELPPAVLPAQWPFIDDQATYESVFLTWAIDSGCALCHSAQGNRGPPLIVSQNEIGNWPASRDAVWSTAVRADSPAEFQVVGTVNGDFWRHAPTHADPEDSYTYTPNDIDFLEGFLNRAWGCDVPVFLAQQDAGPSCGVPAPVDAGVPDTGPDVGPADAEVADAEADLDGGGPDAGVADTGGPVTPTNLCFCDEQPDSGVVDNQYCAP